MDEFGIIDLVCERVEAAATGLPLYIGNSKTGENNSHIVINHLEYHELEYENVLPVNVLIFIKDFNNGMPDTETMKTVTRKIREELIKITHDGGQYRKSELSGVLPLPGMKDGFSCNNNKIRVKTDKI